jgi:hypothetical protein
MIRLRHLKARVLLRPGPTGEQVAIVANALSADLIVTSFDYHHRFLSYFTRAESGILKVQSIPCPVVLVTQNYSAWQGAEEVLRHAPYPILVVRRGEHDFLRMKGETENMNKTTNNASIFSVNADASPNTFRVSLKWQGNYMRHPGSI